MCTELLRVSNSFRAQSKTFNIAFRKRAATCNDKFGMLFDAVFNPHTCNTDGKIYRTFSIFADCTFEVFVFPLDLDSPVLYQIWSRKRAHALFKAETSIGYTDDNHLSVCCRINICKKHGLHIIGTVKRERYLFISFTDRFETHSLSIAFVCRWQRFPATKVKAFKMQQTKHHFFISLDGMKNILQ